MLSLGTDVAHALPGFINTTKEGGIILVPQIDFASAQDLATLPLPSHFISLIYFTGGLCLAQTALLASSLFLSLFHCLFFLSWPPSLHHYFHLPKLEFQTRSFFQHALVIAIVITVSHSTF